jgi:hypothetical protein
METSSVNKEQQQQMSNSGDRLPHHVSFNDDQRQEPQQQNSINLDDISSESRHGLSIKLINYLFEKEKYS